MNKQRELKFTKCREFSTNGSEIDLCKDIAIWIESLKDTVFIHTIVFENGEENFTDDFETRAFVYYEG